jgi:pimeloyl-ACP methyl ester carboxylesterase
MSCVASLAPSRLPVGDGHPVVIFPGLGTDETSLASLSEHCRSLGHRVHDWGRGLNGGARGDIDTFLDGLAADVAKMLTGGDQTATLIGWSLGGLYAREIAKVLQNGIRQVITIGSPFNAAAEPNYLCWLYRALSGRPAMYTSELGARLRKPPPVPTTSIYSRTDEVVPWNTCRHDLASLRVQDVQVDGSHHSMISDPAVFRVVTDRLAQQPGEWQRYAGRA